MIANLIKVVVHRENAPALLLHAIPISGDTSKTKPGYEAKKQKWEYTMYINSATPRMITRGFFYTPKDCTELMATCKMFAEVLTHKKEEDEPKQEGIPVEALP